MLPVRRASRGGAAGFYRPLSDGTVCAGFLSRRARLSRAAPRSAHGRVGSSSRCGAGGRWTRRDHALPLDGCLLACILFSYAEIPVWAEQPLRLPLMQLLVAGINLSFLTGDLFNLFVAFEIMLVASYALLTLEANDRHIKEAFPYLAVNMLAVRYSSSLQVWPIPCSVRSISPTFPAVLRRCREILASWSWPYCSSWSLVSRQASFPLYYWLPNSYPILPFSLGAFYSGMLTKVGIYVLLRTFGTVFPHNLTPLYTALAWLAGLTMVLAVLGAVSRNFNPRHPVVSHRQPDRLHDPCHRLFHAAGHCCLHLLCDPSHHREIVALPHRRHGDVLQPHG